MLPVLVALGASTSITISNVKPRTDTTGNIMDIHDGNFVFLNNTYYYFGAAYGTCLEPAGDSGCAGAAVGACGFQTNHNVTLFTSTDLQTWTNKGFVFGMSDAGISSDAIMFCPKVLYRQRTNDWVLWMNWIDGADFSHSFYASAVSFSPEGPFKIVNKNISTLAFTDLGDFNLFVDDDQTAYIIYTSHIVDPSLTHRMSIERLTPDYTASLGASANSGFFGHDFVEAPAMFKRNGIYYAVFGQCCCYCEEGGPVIVYTSSNVLGPYSMQNMLSAAIPAQQTNILPYLQPQGSIGWLWQGDRWQSSPDRIKGHDFTYFSPMEFDAAGNITAFKWLDNFTIDVNPR